MTRERFGEFEQQVLIALVRLGGEAYSAPLVSELEDRAEQSVSPAAVYIALRRLEKRGYVVSSKTEPAPGEGGRGRRTFRVTAAAVGRLGEVRRTWDRFWEGLDSLAGGA